MTRLTAFPKNFDGSPMTATAFLVQNGSGVFPTEVISPPQAPDGSPLPIKAALFVDEQGDFIPLNPDQLVLNPPSSPNVSDTNYESGLRINLGVGNSFKKDIGLEIAGGANNNFLVLKKDTETGGDFLRCMNMSVATNVIKTRIGGAGQYESVAWMLIGGVVTNNGFPLSDPRHNSVWEYPTPQNTMLSVYSDVTTAVEIRCPATTPSYGVPISIINGRTGFQVLRIEENGDTTWVDNWRPVDTNDPAGGYGAANKALREAYTLFKFGKKDRSVLGAIGAALSPQSYMEAQLSLGSFVDARGDTIRVADAYNIIGALIECPDASKPGLYRSNGYQFEHVADSTKLIGPDRFSWTLNNYHPGTGVITLSGTGTPANKTAEKTAAASAWDCGLWSTETITGDLLVEAIIEHIDISDSNAILGVKTGGTFAGSANLWTQLAYGILLQGNIVVPVVAGVTDYTKAIACDLNDSVAMRIVGTTAYMMLNGETVGIVSTTVPGATARNLAVAFNTVNAKYGEIGFRTL